MDEGFEIKNTNNYKDYLKNKNVLDFAFEYVSLIHKYIEFCVYNLENELPSKLQKKETILFGCDAILNIFLTLLLYTKNETLTIYNCQKAYCYYVEFINQIKYQENDFFKINVKDAILFIYKKTIYSIEPEVKKRIKMNNRENDIFIRLNTFCRLYNSIFYNICIILSESEFNKLDVISHFIKYNTHILNKYFNYENYEKLLFFLYNKFNNKEIYNYQDINESFVNVYKDIEESLKKLKC
tara:strand:- start:4705 stop:5424 length:720 start_codon:yes stop_codon:yes gene_type:complete